MVNTDFGDRFSRVNAQGLQELGRRVPFDAAHVEVIVVGPDRQGQVKRQSQDINVVGISSTDSSSGLREMQPIFGRIDNRDGQRRQAEEKSIEPEGSFSGERSQVSMDFLDRGCRRKHRLDIDVPENQTGAPADDRGQQHVSVGDELHAASCVMPRSP